MKTSKYHEKVVAVQWQRNLGNVTDKKTTSSRSHFVPHWHQWPMVYLK